MNPEIKGFLIDLDGVLYVGDRPVDGAQDSVKFLQENGYAFRFVSNTTRKSCRTIMQRLYDMGFSIPEESIFTPALAANIWLKNNNKQSYYLLTKGDVDRDFSSGRDGLEDSNVDAVIVGDAGERITYASMNTAFRYLIDGAELIALEKDRYWMAADGLSLSAGPFVSALEFATGKTATVMGKPSKSFFELALQDMGLQPGEMAMIGDDILTDIGGAFHAGMRGILVRTGKFREDTAQQAPIQPTITVDSIANLPGILMTRQKRDS